MYIESRAAGTATAKAAAATELPTPREFMTARRRRARLSGWWTRSMVYRWQMAVSLRAAAKRGTDIVGSLSGLVLLAPLLLLTALAIRMESPGPVLFRQTRVGKRGRPFTMYKFRSMRITAESERDALRGDNESADGVIFKLKADPRITRVGRLIRRLSIDELPQLLNVLSGDMSIVGPRPALPSEVDQYDVQARKRLQTKPGLTCLWQIGGRSDLPFTRQVELDLRYLGGKSLLKDLEIIARTVPAVVSGKGAY